MRVLFSSTSLRRQTSSATDACAGAGAGVALKGEAATPEAIAEAISQALGHGLYRAAAARVAEEIAAMPTAEAVAPELERLVPGAP